jgi:DNA-directed RNA polymerase subunit RPC12/RpoP
MKTINPQTIRTIDADNAFRHAVCPQCGSASISIFPAGQNSRWWILGSYLRCSGCTHEFQLDELPREKAVEDSNAEEQRAVRGTAHRSSPKHQRRSANGGQYISADPKPWDTR